MKKFFAVGLGIAAVAGVCYAIKKVLENSQCDCCCEYCGEPEDHDDSEDDAESSSDDSEDGLGKSNISKDFEKSELYKDLMGEDETSKLLDDSLQEAMNNLDKSESDSDSNKADDTDMTDDDKKEEGHSDMGSENTDKNVNDIKESVDSLGSDLTKLFNAAARLTSDKIDEVSKRDDVAKAREAMGNAAAKLNKIVEDASPKAEKFIESAVGSATVMVNDAVKAGENFVGDHPELTELMNKSVDTIKNTLDATFGSGIGDEHDNEDAKVDDEDSDIPDISGVQSTEGKSFDTDLTDSDDSTKEFDEEFNDTDVPPDDGKDINTDLT